MFLQLVVTAVESSNVSTSWGMFLLLIVAGKIWFLHLVIMGVQFRHISTADSHCWDMFFSNSPEHKIKQAVYVWGRLIRNRHLKLTITLCMFYYYVCCKIVKRYDITYVCTLWQMKSYWKTYLISWSRLRRTVGRLQAITRTGRITLLGSSSLATASFLRSAKSSSLISTGSFGRFSTSSVPGEKQNRPWFEGFFFFFL